MSQTEYFLGRQPILDSDQNIVAYELLFRSGASASSAVSDDLLATSTVILNTISQRGIDSVLDRHSGFINLSQAFLMSDLPELLPSDRVVLEILETVEVSEATIGRCRELKAKGFRLALDDFVYSPGYEPLLDLADIVKLDILMYDEAGIEQAVRQLGRWPRLQLLAEKVERQEQFQQLKHLGFSLFQGYFFAHPVIISGRKANPTQITLLRVITQLASDQELSEIERSFKESPTLVVGLLRLVNSVAMGLRRKVGSLHQALVMLGRRQLQRWVQLLLYARDHGSGAPGPLMELAATRARTMELLSQRHPDPVHRGQEGRDRAFMTGVLSLLDALLGIPMQEALAQLGLIDEVRAALVAREGFQGQLLALIESVEAGDEPLVGQRLEALGLTLADLNQAGLEAMQWVASLGREVDS